MDRDGEKLPPFSIHWQDLLPGFVKHILFTGPENSALRSHLSEQGVEAGFLQNTSLPASADRYDAVFCMYFPDKPEEFIAHIRRMASCLSPTGRLILYLHAAPAGNSRFPFHQFFPVLDRAGFYPYRWYPKDRPGDIENGCILLAVPNGYNPMAHARQCAEQGDPAAAIDLIERIDNSHFPDQETLVSALVVKHACYLQWMELQPPDNRPGPDSALFMRAQKDFYTIIHLKPLLHPAWRTHAQLWRAFGNDAMAARLLRSVLHVQEDPVTRQLLNTFDSTRPVSRVPETAPIWSGCSRPPRILVITHDNSDYGMDSLYDGLCTVLGPQNVVEFPWKGTLHGRDTEAAQNYPCVFDYPGEPRNAAAIEAELRNGQFDIILYADVVQFSRRETVRRFLAAAPDIPVMVYDTWDSTQNYQPVIQDYLGRETIALYFKREMLAGIDYGPRAFPLPFGYPDRLVPESVPEKQSKDFFWAGKWLFGLRSLYLPWLEKLLDRKFSGASYDQESYKAALLQARAGFSFFGFGFDTVRYWELPAHGCLLLAERPLIRIPHDFEDGISALFFEDLPELEEKMGWISAHPKACGTIARAGRRHFLEHHTASQRARQLLGRIEEHRFRD
jgi:hypothetical protein